MPAVEPGKIRNVAVVGHRGTGKTSLVEAALFQSGAVNRLGQVEQGTTVSDWDDDEHKRQMSLQASVCHCEWQERKLNLIDTPGDAGFQGDSIAALRVVEGALIVVSGVMASEVGTLRAWNRAEDLGLSRVLVVNMLDRERADFLRTLDGLRSQLSERCVAVHLPIGSEHELSGIVDLLHLKAYTSPDAEKEGAPVEIPAELATANPSDDHGPRVSYVSDAPTALALREWVDQVLGKEVRMRRCVDRPGRDEHEQGDDGGTAKHDPGP